MPNTTCLKAEFALISQKKLRFRWVAGAGKADWKPGFGVKVRTSVRPFLPCGAFSAAPTAEAARVSPWKLLKPKTWVPASLL